MFQWPLEDVAPRATYVAGRGDRDVGYTRERVYDDQVVRVGWRDDEVLNGGGDIVSSSLLKRNPHPLTCTSKSLKYECQ